MPIAGGLIAESLRIGSVLEGVKLTVKRISRADVGDVETASPSPGRSSTSKRLTKKPNDWP